MKYTFRTIQECKIKNQCSILISTSLFKMKCPYKNFRQYYIEPIMIWIEKIPKNSYVRLYVDESVIDDASFKELIDKKYKNLEIVFYQFDDFYIVDKNYDPVNCPKSKISSETNLSLSTYPSQKIKPYTGHDGTFGSIVRLFPIYKEYRPRNIEYVWITDIDLSFKVFSYKYIANLKKNKANISFFSKSCYTKPWVDIELKHPVFAGRIIMSTKVKTDKNDMLKFLRDVRNNKYKHIMKEIEILYSNKDREVSDVKWFPVGFDELFINKYLQPLFLKYKRVIYFDISLSLFRDRLNKEEKKEFNRLFELCQELRKPVPIKARERYIEMNEQLYQKIKDEDFSDFAKPGDKVLDYCRRDYEENNQNFDLTEIGATSILIREKGDE